MEVYSQSGLLERTAPGAREVAEVGKKLLVSCVLILDHSLCPQASLVNLHVWELRHDGDV